MTGCHGFGEGQRLRTFCPGEGHPAVRWDQVYTCPFCHQEVKVYRYHALDRPKVYRHEASPPRKNV